MKHRTLTIKQDYELKFLTWAQGYLTATYDELVEALGEPTWVTEMNYRDDREKVTCRWSIMFANGVHATVYDWKIRCPYQDQTVWHIGGQEIRSVLALRELFPSASTS